MRQSIQALTTIGFLASTGILALVGSGFGDDTSLDEELLPIQEAEMPEGFPATTPVGRIEVKRYPAYRRATASGFAEFWTLFRHIQQNGVSMTAPVEMDFGDARAARTNKRSMSFLYENANQGSTGRQGTVDVVDVEATTVVSIGCRGPQTAASVDAPRDRLLEWMEDRGGYVPAGPLRVMGYNSPFVPRDRNFFEVQIPLEQAATPATASPFGNEARE